MVRTGLGLMLLAVFLVGCSQGEPGLKGVQGKVTVNGQPAAKGTQVNFNLVGGSYTFSTRTKADGTYSYMPPAEAPLQTGTYRVSVLPPPAETIVDETGMSVAEKPTSGPKTYKKYSDPETSGIEAELGQETVTLDINVES